MSSSLHYGPSKQYDGDAKARADIDKSVKTDFL